MLKGLIAILQTLDVPINKPFKDSNKHEDDNDLLSADECCKILNVSKNTLWRWNKTGYLQSFKIGRCPYYRKSDIDTLKKGK